MTTYHFVFRPVLNFEHKSGKSEQQDYPTFNSDLNKKIISGLIDDKICFTKNFREPVSFVRYWLEDELFLPTLTRRWTDQIYTVDGEPKIHLLAVGSPSPKELSDFLENLDPDRGGPDSWMEGDIMIVNKETAEAAGYESIELWPYLEKLTIVDKNQNETEIDFKNLSSQSDPNIIGCPFGDPEKLMTSLKELLGDDKEIALRRAKFFQGALQAHISNLTTKA